MLQFLVISRNAMLALCLILRRIKRNIKLSFNVFKKYFILAKYIKEKIGKCMKFLLRGNCTPTQN